ncbi:MAG TPA: adhesin, partial [Colwellia sp.]|nr:adhesin [Colwellia sp.]
SDLPAGAILSGTNVQVIHLVDGKTIHEYVFTEASLIDLTLSSAGDDFAGIFTLPIRIIATDSISGDTYIEDSQSLTIDVTPVVDGITISSDSPMLEDVQDSFDLNIVFNDTDLLPALGGKEKIQIDNNIDNNLTITLLDGGTLIDDTGYFILKSGSSNVWQFTGTKNLQMIAALASLSLQPTEHLAGEYVFSIQLTGNIIDTASMLAGRTSISEAFFEVIQITVDAVTDPAKLITSDSEGDEDTAIYLSGLSAELIDQDGSETLYLTVQGLPTGAILATDEDGDSGNDPVPLPNNGVDGGTFNGSPTFSWTLTPSQLATLVLIPPLDFSGDIPLTLQAITKDDEPGEYVTTSSSFTVGVRPVSDGVDVYIEPDNLYSGIENDFITVDLGAISLDSDADEQIYLSVHISADSDESALINIDTRASINVGTAEAKFTSDGAGGFLALLTLDTNEISTFDILMGNLAWGTFNMSVGVASIDKNTVNSNNLSDISPFETFNFLIELTPEVDSPRWVDYGDVNVSIADNIPLDLALTLQNPAPDEEGYLVVLGLLDGLSLNHGTQQGSEWIVEFSDLATLEIIGASMGDSFDLTLTPYAQLDENTENGITRVININVEEVTSTSTMSSSNFSSDSAMSENISFVNERFITSVLDELSSQTLSYDS